MPLIDRNQVLRLVPHGPAMCLIDSVVDWSEAHIVCESLNHARCDHPLRHNGRVSALHLIEYGAQAMAIHGALVARAQGGRARPGMLVSARDFRTVLARIDDLDGALELHGRCEMLRADAMMHSFEARHAGRTVGSGRVSVLLQTP